MIRAFLAKFFTKPSVSAGSRGYSFFDGILSKESGFQVRKGSTCNYAEVDGENFRVRVPFQSPPSGASIPVSMAFVRDEWIPFTDRLREIGYDGYIYREPHQVTLCFRERNDALLCKLAMGGQA